MPPAITIESLTPERLQDYLRFFDTRALADNAEWDGCFCYYPLHDPQQTDWKQRTGPENREAVSDCILRGQAQGFLAYLDGEVVGWCSAGSGELYPMLRGGRSMTETTGVVDCFVVAPEMRGQGIAAALDAACAGLQTQGLSEVMARPQRNATSAAENHLGPLSMYLHAGFEVVSERPDGTVRVRKALTSELPQ